MRYTKQCPCCHERFAAGRKDKEFCSLSCKNKIKYHEKKRSGIELKRPQLRVIQGELYHTIRSAELIENYLDFCHSLFWSYQDFTEEEKIDYKTLIAEYFKDTDNADVVFLELVERAILAKRYVALKPTRFMPKPAYWFDRTYEYGLEGTKGWYDQNTLRRLENDSHEEEIAMLALAILDLYKNGDYDQINLYREYFLQADKSGLFQIYTDAIIHSQLLSA